MVQKRKSSKSKVSLPRSATTRGACACTCCRLPCGQTRCCRLRPCHLELQKKKKEKTGSKYIDDAAEEVCVPFTSRTRVRQIR